MDAIISLLLGKFGEQFAAKVLLNLLTKLKGLTHKTSTKLDDEAVDMLIAALRDATGQVQGTQ